MPAVVTIDEETSESTYSSYYCGEQFPLRLHVTTREGVPVDLSSADLSMQLEPDGAGEVVEKEPGDFIVDGDDDSRCEVTLTTEDTASPGTYRGQLTIDTGLRVRKGDPITLMLLSGNSPLPLSDIRYGLKQEEAVEAGELDMNLLAMARQRAIDDWNGQPGRQTQRTVDNFPDRFTGQWLKGAMGHALMMRARDLAPEAFPVSAGGVQFDDVSPKVESYIKFAQQMLAQWEKFIHAQQYNETLRRSFRTLS